MAEEDDLRKKKLEREDLGEGFVNNMWEKEKINPRSNHTGDIDGLMKNYLSNVPLIPMTIISVSSLSSNTPSLVKLQFWHF